MTGVASEKDIAKDKPAARPYRAKSAYSIVVPNQQEKLLLAKIRGVLGGFQPP